MWIGKILRLYSNSRLLGAYSMTFLQIGIIFVCFLLNFNDIVEIAAFTQELHYGGDALTKMLLFCRIF
jgi:hypothetical protein